MESAIERKCKRSPEIPDRKFEGGVCISESEVLVRYAVFLMFLKAALGAWHVFRVKILTSYRFIAYKQYICCIYGRILIPKMEKRFGYPVIFVCF